MVESVTQIERLVESVSGPINRRGFHCMPGARRARPSHQTRAGRASHNTEVRALRAPDSRRAPGARPSMNVLKERKKKILAD